MLFKMNGGDCLYSFAAGSVFLTVQPLSLILYAEEQCIIGLMVLG